MTTTNTTPILELWKAMGEAGIQPPEIDIRIQRDRPVLFIRDTSLGDLLVCEIQKSVWWKHAGFILTGHAETWLLATENWTIYKQVASPHASPEIVVEYSSDLGTFDSLPDAIRAEIGRV